MRLRKVIAIVSSLAVMLAYMPAMTYATEGDEGANSADAVATIGSTEYGSLQDALGAAGEGDTIVLHKDLDLTASGNYANDRIPISKSVTIDGGNNTITVTNRGFGVGVSAAGMLDVTFKDVTIVNNSNGGRCIDTRGNINSLTLDNVILDVSAAASGYVQPLTVGGNQSQAATVTINDSQILGGKTSYAIITYNPVAMEIKGSTITGWADLYFKGPDGSAGSAGSTVTIENSTLNSKNEHSGVTNAFSAIVYEDSNIAVDITNSAINISTTGDQQQAIVSAEDVSGIQTTLGEGNVVTLSGNGTFVINDKDVLTISGGTFNTEVPEEYLAEGFAFVKNEDGTYTVAEEAPAYTLSATLDKESYTLSGASTTIKATVVRSDNEALSAEDRADWNIVDESNAVVKYGDVSFNTKGIATIKATRVDATSLSDAVIPVSIVHSGTTYATTNVTLKPSVSVTTNSKNRFVADGPETVTNLKINGTAVDPAGYVITSNDETAATVEAAEGEIIITPLRAGSAKFKIAKADEPGQTAEFSITFIDPVAKIGDTNYKTVSEALKGAQNGDTITLLADVTESVNYGGNSPRIDGFELTIDVNGHTWTGAAGNNYALRVDYGIVTVKDSVGGGGVHYSDNYAFMVSHLAGDYKSRLVLESGTFTGKTSVVQVGLPAGSGANYKYYGGELVVNGGTFNTVADEGEVYDENGNFRYTLNILDYNESAYAGGQYSPSSITVLGGSFDHFDPMNNAAEGTGTDFTADGYVSVDNGDGTFTVKKVVTVTYDADNGTELKTETMTEGDKAAKPADPAKDGYIFGGWYLGDEEYDFDAPVTGDITLKASWIEPAAQIGDANYASLADAVSAAEAGDTIRILSDIETNSYVEIEKSITIDLDGHKISRSGNALLNPMGEGVMLTVKDSKGGGSVESGIPVYVENGAGFILEAGTVKSAADGFAAIYGPEASAVTINGGNVIGGSYAVNVTGEAAVTVNGGTVSTSAEGSFTIALLGDNGSLTVNGGTIEATGGDSVAISDNGSNAKTDITINGGTITSAKDIAIYKPAAGALEIAGGIITGGTGIYVKSGSLVIPDGSSAKITGTGDKAEFVHYGNGALSTGEAVVIENCGYPGGAPEASIAGGIFESKHAETIASYAWTEEGAAEENEPIKDFVTGGAFVGDSIGEAALPAGKKLKLDEESGYYFIIDVYTVTFDADNGSAATKAEVESGSKAVKPEDPSKDGFVFGGWYLGDAAYDFDTAVTGDITLKASWTEAAASVTKGDRTTYFETLEEAIEAVEDGQTVAVIGGDVTAVDSEKDFYVLNSTDAAITVNGTELAPGAKINTAAAALQKALADAAQEIADLTEENQELKDANDALTQANEELTAALETATTEKEEALAAAKTAQDKYDAAVEELDRQRAEIVRISTELGTANANLAKAADDLADAQAAYDQLAADAEATETELAQAQNDLEAAQQAKAAAEEEIAELTQTLTEKQGQITQLGDELTQLQEDYANKVAELADKEQALTEAQNALAEAQEDIEAANTEAEEAKTAMNDAVAAMNAAIAEKNQIQEAYDQAITDLTAKQSEIADLSAQLIEAQQKVISTSEALTQAQADYIELQRSAAATEDELEQAQRDLEQMTAARDDALRNVSSLTESLQTAQTEKEALQTQLESVQQELETANNNYETAKQQLTQAQADLTEANQRAQEAEQRAQEAEERAEIAEGTKIDITNYVSSITKTKYIYNGNVKVPRATVKGLTADDFTVTYANNKAIGTGTATIEGKGKYTGKIIKKFIVTPAKGVVSKATPAKKKITITAKAQKGGVKYQYSVRIKNGKWKYYTSTKTKYVVKKLKSKKKYNVRVRAFKKVGTKTYYGAWSKVKTVKVK